MIPFYIYLAVLSMFLVGVADFLYGRAARKGISYGTLTCSQALFVVAANGTWAYAAGVYAWSWPFLISALAAILFFIAFWAFMRSVSLGEASVSTPISQLSFVVSVLMATLWMRERLSARKILGLFFAVATIAAFSI